jgi:hypothetical protein
MIDRRRLIRFGAAVPLMMTGLPLSSSLAQQGFQRFFPLLVELPGWTGGKPDGAAVEIPGASMLSATREYRRGEARLNAQIIVGAAAQGALAAIQPGVKIDTPQGRISTATIGGLQTLRTFNVSDKSGGVVVALGPSAMFNLAFNGVGEDEALELARKFNWKAMQSALPK